MDILVSKDVITKKEHNCWGCGRKFPKGSKLTFVKGVDSGEFASAYWCQTCNEYWNRNMSYDDEIGYGELKSEDFRVWEIIRKEVEINE